MHITLSTVRQLAACEHIVRMGIGNDADSKVYVCPECGAYKLTERDGWHIPRLAMRLGRDVVDEREAIAADLELLHRTLTELAVSLETVFEFACKAEFTVEAEPLAELSDIARELCNGVEVLRARFLDRVPALDIQADPFPTIPPINMSDVIASKAR